MNEACVKHRFGRDGFQKRRETELKKHRNFAKVYALLPWEYLVKNKADKMDVLGRMTRRRRVRKGKPLTRKSPQPFNLAKVKLWFPIWNKTQTKTCATTVGR